MNTKKKTNEPAKPVVSLWKRACVELGLPVADTANHDLSSYNAPADVLFARATMHTAHGEEVIHNLLQGIAEEIVVLHEATEEGPLREALYFLSVRLENVAHLHSNIVDQLEKVAS